MQIESCSFQEAVRIVAEKSGIPMPHFTESESQAKTAQDREVILKLNEWAAQFFESQLLGEADAEVRDYVRSRGITDETRRRFRIGYAPDRWDLLIKHLDERGATRDEIGLSGLVVVKEDGGLYDRFRGRLIFPITDSQNRIIAFGGRVTGQGEPKYLNSPETAAYTKGRNLYGLSHAKEAIRKAGFAIIVEGYLDCVIPFQEGIHNVVASLGTALTDSQVRLLRRYMETPQIVVNFDPDPAGQAATLRSIETLLSEGFKVNVLQLPTKEDPDDFVRSKGAAKFREILRSTQPYIEFVLDTALSAYDITRPSGKVAAINSVLPHLVRMRDKVERLDYAEQLAHRFKVDSAVIRQELKRAATERRGSLNPKRLSEGHDINERELLELMGKPVSRRIQLDSPAEHLDSPPERPGQVSVRTEPAAPRAPADHSIESSLGQTPTSPTGAILTVQISSIQSITRAERQLLELILVRRDLRAAVIDHLSEEDLDGLAAGPLFSAIKRLEADGVDPDYDALASVLDDANRGWLAALMVSNLAWADGDDFDNLFKKATEAITSLRLKRLERRLEAVQTELVQAERDHNSDRVHQLFVEKADLKRRMLRLAG
jgi:DNA primase catalytic core